MSGCKFLNVVAPIVGGVVGFFIGGPAGAAAGAAAGSAAVGQDRREIATSAALAYVGGAGAQYLGAGTQAAAGVTSAQGTTGVLAANAAGASTGTALGAVELGGAAAGGAAATPWLTKAGQVLDVASGAYGLQVAGQISDLAAQAAAQQDPFAASRGGYIAQLQALERDPNSITSRPGYQFGLEQGEQSLLRQTAATGFGGSGNEAIALKEYSQAYAGMYLSAEQQRLANLAGAQFAPSGGNTQLTGEIASADITSRSLASIGYGFGSRRGYTDKTG